MDSQGVCSAEYDLALQNYRFAIGASLMFSIVAALFHRCCLAERLQGAPGLAAQFFSLFGVMKIIFAAFIYFGFQPHCPDNFSCSLADPLPVYPISAAVVGVGFIYLGFTKWQRSREIGGEAGKDMDGPIFDPVSSVEMA